MNGLLRETGVSFTVGQRLSSQDLNVMNDTINRLVRTVNSFLKGKINVNFEENSTEPFTWNNAVLSIPEERRSIGTTIQFIDTDGDWVEYTFNGQSTDEIEWVDRENWAMVNYVIDGGEWGDEVES